MSEINNKEVENTVQSETKEDWKNAEAAEPKIGGERNMSEKDVADYKEKANDYNEAHKEDAKPDEQTKESVIKDETAQENRIEGSLRQAEKDVHQDDKPSVSSDGDREIGAKSKGIDDLGINH